jgi:hypothetical protein
VDKKGKKWEELTYIEKIELLRQIRKERAEEGHLDVYADGNPKP